MSWLRDMDFETRMRAALLFTALGLGTLLVTAWIHHHRIEALEIACKVQP